MIVTIHLHCRLSYTAENVGLAPRSVLDLVDFRDVQKCSFSAFYLRTSLSSRKEEDLIILIYTHDPLHLTLAGTSIGQEQML